MTSLDDDCNFSVTEVG